MMPYAYKLSKIGTWVFGGALLLHFLIVAVAFLTMDQDFGNGWLRKSLDQFIDVLEAISWSGEMGASALTIAAALVVGLVVCRRVTQKWERILKTNK